MRISRIRSREIKELEEKMEEIKKTQTEREKRLDEIIIPSKDLKTRWFLLAKTNSTRLGVIGFFIYFIALLANLYRYTVRLAAFYEARADALTLAAPPPGNFSLAVDKLAPDNMNFGKPPKFSPMVEMAERGVRGIPRWRQ